MPDNGSDYPPGRTPASVERLERVYGNFSIRPHRSMSDGAMRRLLVVIGTLGAVFDVAMFLQFGWMVGVITLIDIGIVGVALTLSQRERHAVETVTVLGDGVQVEHRAANGRLLVSQWLPLFPLSVRYSEEQSALGHVELVSGSRHVRNGAALLPDERRSFCSALLDSLDRAGAGVARYRFHPSTTPRDRGLDPSIRNYK